jgi:hypothetical protein
LGSRSLWRWRNVRSPCSWPRMAFSATSKPAADGAGRTTGRDPDEIPLTMASLRLWDESTGCHRRCSARATRPPTSCRAGARIITACVVRGVERTGGAGSSVASSCRPTTSLPPGQSALSCQRRRPCLGRVTQDKQPTRSPERARGPVLYATAAEGMASFPYSIDRRWSVRPLPPFFNDETLRRNIHG